MIQSWRAKRFESTSGFQTEETTGMRLWHLSVAILVLAVLMTIVRDSTGRAVLIVFVTALGEGGMSVAMGMALFQTIGAAAMARGLPDLAKGLAGTVLILILVPIVMLAWLLLGVLLLRAPAS